MNIINKLAVLAISMVFALNLNAQETKYVQIIENGKVTYTTELTAVDSIIVNTVPANAVVINGVRWAKYNVNTRGTFTQNIEDYGMFYQWNRATGWNSTDATVTGWDDTYPTGTTWEASNNVCPTGWRVPTISELASLLETENTWTQVNGVNGRQFGSGENLLFFPAAGSRYSSGGALGGQGGGGYWSSTPNGSSYAHYLDFGSGNADVGSNNRTFGFSVRCVVE